MFSLPGPGGCPAALASGPRAPLKALPSNCAGLRDVKSCLLMVTEPQHVRPDCGCVELFFAFRFCFT